MYPPVFTSVNGAVLLVTQTVNHSAPSGPVVMSCGADGSFVEPVLPGATPGAKEYFVMTPAVVIRPM